ncbi:nucleotide pyrophosphohydrolase [Paenibacillus piri]|uniref:Nucleotide pyrophosphohydrolase n=1 Tax=Paenibacillus piri TaxID=2547395 RepID=A0A4R5KIN4_9BACL|nr:nucleotide pyrophosphohydrolase [Paenibacillus piri]TDF95379.1 nucleotide pyrophosphohydrolase [Paenibacillus piri]
MEHIIKKIIKFRDARDWKQFHNSKDLAISLSLEASELLENFQWKSSEAALLENREEIKDELADVMIYALMMAHDLDINIESAIFDKLKKNEVKYPVEKFKGTSKKYTEG